MSKSITQILNNAYDEDNEQLRGTGIGTQSTNSTMYSATQILNNVYDEATKTLNIGGPGGTAETITNAGSLSGAAPSGAKWGIDTTTGTAYYVDGSGDWAEYVGLVDDQSASSYIDVGAVRIQWGRVVLNSDASQTFTFPASFADDQASVVITRQGTNLQLAVGVTSVTSTTFDIDRENAIDGDFTIHWQAIGLKP